MIDDHWQLEIKNQNQNQKIPSVLRVHPTHQNTFLRDNKHLFTLYIYMEQLLSYCKLPIRISHVSSKVSSFECDKVSQRLLDETRGGLAAHAESHLLRGLESHPRKHQMDGRGSLERSSWIQERGVHQLSVIGHSLPIRCHSPCHSLPIK
jgi:hypothetical protein